MASGSGYRGIVWVLVLVSVGCSDNGSGTSSGNSNSISATGTPVTHSTTTATSSGPNTSSGGAPTTSSVTSVATTGGSGGSNSGGSAGSDAGSLGGLAGADTTGTTGETVEGDTCSFTLSHTRSTAIGTVQIVSWSTDLSNVTEAHIDFGLTDSELSTSAPVDLEEPDYRTLLLGMKGDRSYSFRIVASSADQTCTGPELSFMTGPVPEWVPTISKGPSLLDAAKGFIVTTSGLGLLTRDRNLPSVFIFDTDGDVVWWTPEVIQDAAGARMSWDGKTMYFVNAYPADVFGISMDGMTSWEIPELAGANHDLTVLPDGGIVTMVSNGVSEPFSIVELQSDGTVVSIVDDLSTLYTTETFHPNAIHYYPADNSFTLSDLNLNGFVKFTRDGELLWQLGGSNPLGDSFELVGIEPWLANHGHHLTSDGSFLFFNNFTDTANSGPSTVFEVQLDEDDWIAAESWQYRGDGNRTSLQLGDVERLPNGNALITYSNEARIVEVGISGEELQSFKNDMFLPEGTSSPVALFGYASFRTALYGPPPR